MNINGIGIKGGWLAKGKENSYRIGTVDTGNSHHSWTEIEWPRSTLAPMPHPPRCWRGHDCGSLLWPQCALLEILSGVLGELATARWLYQNSPQSAQRSHLQEGAIPAAHHFMKPSKNGVLGEAALGSCRLLLATGRCWKEPHTLQEPREIKYRRIRKRSLFLLQCLPAPTPAPPPPCNSTFC